MSNRMLTAPRRALAAAVLACPLAGLVAEARAAIVVDIYQDGANVRSVLSGSFDTSSSSSSIPSLALGNHVWGGNGAINGAYFSSSATGTTPARSWTGTTVSTPLGSTRYGDASGIGIATATSFTVSGFTAFRIIWDGAGTPLLNIDSTYAGGAMSGDALFAGTTMAALGLDNYGSYVYGFGSGASYDTVTVNLLQSSPSVIPGAGIAGLATLGLAGIARRRRR